MLFLPRGEAAETVLERKPDDRELTALGLRLEKLMSERETAEHLRVKAKARFAEIVPELDSDQVSISRFWDCLIDPMPNYPAITADDHWWIIRHYYYVKEEVPFATVRTAAEQSRYADAAERVRSIDLKIHAAAHRALAIEANSMAGVKAQALAMLALDQAEYGRQPGRGIHAHARTLSRAVVALTERGGGEAA